MNINDVFPSKWISAADLQGREVAVRIERVTVENLGTANAPENKPILYFQGKQKGLALNKTNAGTIEDMFGPETDRWIGQTITLGPSWVDFQGKQVLAVRVRPTRTNGGAPPQQNWQAPPQQQIAPPPPPPAPPAGGNPWGQPAPQAQGAAPDLDDQIPF